MTDKELAECIRSAARGDQCSIEMLMLKYTPMIVHYATIDDIFDEDLFQELNLCVLIALKTFRKNIFLKNDKK